MEYTYMWPNNSTAITVYAAHGIFDDLNSAPVGHVNSWLLTRTYAAFARLRDVVYPSYTKTFQWQDGDKYTTYPNTASDVPNNEIAVFFVDKNGSIKPTGFGNDAAWQSGKSNQTSGWDSEVGTKVPTNGRLITGSRVSVYIDVNTLETINNCPNLGSASWKEAEAVILHELLHAVGLYHLDHPSVMGGCQYEYQSNDLNALSIMPNT